MTKKELIQRAVVYFNRQGYSVILPTRCNGLDLVVESPARPKTIVFVAVMPLKGKYFHLQPFGITKTRKARFDSLVNGAMAWTAKNVIGKAEKCEFDAVTIRDDGTIDHVENAGRKELR